MGTGYNDNYLKDFYRFDPNAATGQQWTIVSGFGGYKRQYGTAFVIDDVAYICCGDNNGTLVDDLLPIMIVMKIMTTIMPLPVRVPYLSS